MNKRLRQFKKANPFLFYQTEKVPVVDILPDYTPPFGQDHCIITHAKDGPVITNFCSSSYNLVTNELLVLPMLEAILEEYPDVIINARSQRDARFYIDFIFNQKHNVANPKKKSRVDEVFPRFKLVNSYDGKIKYSREFGFHRTVCENGMSVPEGEQIRESGHHTEKLEDLINQEILISTTQNFLENAKDYMKPYHDLRRSRVEDLEGRINATLENTEFPRRQAEAVAQRIMQEMAQLKSTANDWLVYNGFNGELNHNEEFKMTISKREEVDRQVLNFLIKG